MDIDIEEVKKRIKYFREDNKVHEFYVSLLLYDVMGYTEEEITKAMIERTYDIEDEYDSIYNSDLKEELRYEIDNKDKSIDELDISI